MLARSRYSVAGAGAPSASAASAQADRAWNAAASVSMAAR
jgi:hypothetical protein